MFKFVLKVIVWLAVTTVCAMISPGLPTYKHILFGAAVAFGIPSIYARWKESARNSRWKREADESNRARESAEEQAHQTSLRRERERMEMHAEMRVKELLATLEVQFRIDSRKMEQLALMKAEFASRQQSDMSSLLGRLEAMKAGA